MQYLKIEEDTKLIDLSRRVGERNVEQMLALNNLNYEVRVGQQWKNLCDTYTSNPKEVSAKRKMAILNTMTTDSDVFESACMATENDWKIIDALNTFPSHIQVPSTMELADAYDVLGNGIAVGSMIYDAIMDQLNTVGRIYDYSVFNEVSNIRNVALIDSAGSENSYFSQWFKLPWGKVTLYSSLTDDSIDFPVYPKEYGDGRSANYSTMPDMIYQYEPWQVYESSGPRTIPLTFEMHRHLWTGNHNDGKANELIRFCEANCYPNYSGSAVHTSTVSFYLAGKCLVTGILKNVSVDWSGPIADDGFYLYFELKLEIEEVSKQALNYTTVRKLPLIG